MIRYLVVPHCGFNMRFPNVKHLFMLFAICMALMKCLFTSFAILRGLLFVCLFVTYIPGISFIRCFFSSQSMACHFSCVFWRTVFHFDEIVYVCSCIDNSFGCVCKKYLYNRRLQRFVSSPWSCRVCSIYKNLYPQFTGLSEIWARA